MATPTPTERGAGVGVAGAGPSTSLAARTVGARTVIATGAPALVPSSSMATSITS